MRTVLLCALCLACTYAGAQFSNVGQPRVDLTNVIPKTPQAAQLARVNEITVNAARGVPQIEFPLHVATVGDLKIPISISYDASGIKYDDIPSSVGLKWVLKAGGEISRSINGREDEIFYFANAYRYSQDIISMWNIWTDSAQMFLTDVNLGYKDVMHDEYAYNYLNRSGNFYFRHNKLWDSENPYTVKIEPDNFSNFDDITITDEFGNKAYFGDDNNDFSFITYGGTGYVSPYLPPYGITSWKLVRLQAYTGQEATFDYDTSSYSIDKIMSEAYVFRHEPYQEFSAYNCNCGTSDINQNIMYGIFGVSIVTKITTPNEEVDFYYSTDNSLSLYKRRLDSITVKDRVYNTRVKKFRFKYGKYDGVDLLRLDEVWSFGTNNDSLLVAGFHYTGGVAGIHSDSRDIFNYNNGAMNSTLISNSDADCPYAYGSADRTISAYSIANGTMDSIYYPTGGKAAFFYSPNKIGDVYGPGMRVDSIHYYNSENALTSNTSYVYSDMQGGFTFYGTVNHTVVNYDNYLCPVETFNSEANLHPIYGGQFHYGNVEIRQKGATSAATQLVKEFYTSQVNCYFKSIPVLSKKMYFRANSLSDTLRTESYTYTNFDVDSVEVDWMYPAYSTLPSQLYYLDGMQYDNTNECKVIYSGVGRHAFLKPNFNQLTAMETRDIDQNSSTVSLVNSATRSYNNYWQPVVDFKLNSDGTKDSTVFNYLYTNGGAVSTAAITNNLYGLVDRTSKYTNNGRLLERSRARFATQTNGFVQPDSFYLQTLSNAEVSEKVVTSYDAEGQANELDDKYGFYTSLLRDYNNAFVIAHATNARLTQIAYTSFETNYKGGWTFSGSTAVESNSPTGLKAYNLSNGNITKSSLSAGTTYIVSYWSKSGSYYNVNSTSPARTGKTIGSWTYYEHEITGTSSVTISGGNYIDELRLYPVGAQVVTFTFQPLIGVTSQCDAANRITYYEYDPFGRLKLIRDQDKNVIKAYDYQYKVAQNQ